MFQSKRAYLVPGSTIEQFIGQYITTAITGYGQVVAQVVKYDKASKMATLNVFTPSGVRALTVHETDMYGIAQYQGPIPPVFGSGMGQMGQMGQGGQMGQMGQPGQMGQMGQMGQPGQMGQMGQGGQQVWPWWVQQYLGGWGGWGPGR
ncbi:hypothetical protein QUF49_14310 [Fictibacillus sp. b24]|uniref:hypothetical protein n=1 Tax=Fictibacillus sp. b24 TaxID=3055863 RepID=UPI0025A226E5|nr:hypothetical protein [Fictibacillus sp. b24]MDM5317178.1 hypothetical protein [Fictibacillus sp. b24]